MSSKLDKHIDTGQKAEVNEKFGRQSDKLVRMLYVIAGGIATFLLEGGFDSYI